MNEQSSPKEPKILLGNFWKNMQNSLNFVDFGADVCYNMFVVITTK